MIGQLVQARNDHARLVEAAADAACRSSHCPSVVQRSRMPRAWTRCTRRPSSRKLWCSTRRSNGFHDRWIKDFDMFGVTVALTGGLSNGLNDKIEQQLAAKRMRTDRDLSDHPEGRQVEEGGRAAPVQARGLRHDRCGLQGRGRRLHRGQRQHRRLRLHQAPACGRGAEIRARFSSAPASASRSPSRRQTTPPFRCST